jgi:hypothetical protein
MEVAFGPTLQQLKELQENGFTLGQKKFEVEIRVVSDMKALISVSCFTHHRVSLLERLLGYHELAPSSFVFGAIAPRMTSTIMIRSANGALQ